MPLKTQKQKKESVFCSVFTEAVSGSVLQIVSL